MKIRDAISTDLPTIHALNQANTPHVGTVSLDWLTTYLQTSFYFRVIEVDKQVVGFLLAMLPTTEYDSENFLWFKKNYISFVYVDRIAVDAAYSRRGYGKRLYKDLEIYMRNQSKVLACEVNSKPANPDSLAFHKKLGFQKVGELLTKNGSVKVDLLAKTILYYQ